MLPGLPDARNLVDFSVLGLVPTWPFMPQLSLMEGQ